MNWTQSSEMTLGTSEAVEHKWVGGWGVGLIGGHATERYEYCIYVCIMSMSIYVCIMSMSIYISCCRGSSVHQC